MPGLYEQLERSDAVTYGAVGGIWVMVLYAKPKAADMWLAKPALAAMVKRYPAGFPTLTWVTLAAGVSMDDDARKAATTVTSSFAKQLLCQATLVEGTGFQAAAVRAIISGLDAVSRSPNPKKVFSTVGPAVAWCAPYRVGGDAASAADITRELTSLRETAFRAP